MASPVKTLPGALSKLVTRLVEADTVRSVADAVADVSREFFNWDAFIFSERIEDSGKFLRVVAWDTINGLLQEIDSTRFPPPALSLACGVVCRREPSDQQPAS